VTAGPAGQLQVVRLLRRRLRTVIAAEQPDLLHVHSPCLNGLAALGSGVPLLYEMRSSWEDAAVSSGTTTEGSLRYRLSRWLETLVARRAGAVATICNGLRSDLVHRGVSDARIVVAENGIDPASRQSPDAAAVDTLRRRYGLKARQVIGFFGSFFEWEGLADLVMAMPVLRDRHPAARLLLVGGGKQESQLRSLVAARDLDDTVIFAGRVPHAEINAHYGLADVMAFPRRSSRLTELVTPLKPLESMALGCLVVASAVGGHRELIEHARTGFLFPPGDVDALAAAISHALDGSADHSRIRESARLYVERERTWAKTVAAYLPAYERLVAS